MEYTSKFKDSETPSLSTTSNSHNVDPPLVGVGIPIKRSDPNSPYPTTFVTADTSSFKQVVQMLTGSSKTSPVNKHPFKKLYQRRNYGAAALNNTIITQNASFPPEVLSPSMLDFPSLTLSPVTPLTHQDPFDKSWPSVAAGGGSSTEEERAIAEKRFYMHPSPVSTPRESEPQLLSLFPLSSPRVSHPSTHHAS